MIGIYGAGGFGREMAAVLMENREMAGVPDFIGGQTLLFIDDRPTASRIVVAGCAIPVVRLADFPAGREHSVILAIGNGAARARAMEACDERAISIESITDYGAHVGLGVTYGRGAIFCHGVRMTTDITVGKGVILNLNCTVGHDTRLGDFVTAHPGVHISGCVHVGQGVTIGTGAVIINGTRDRPLTVGDGAVIGAGAVVTRPIPAHVTAMGVPAKAKRA